MDPLNLQNVCDYVNDHILDFHERRLKSLGELRLEKLLNKNPYLFKAKNITTANELISGLLDAFLSSSEEKLFGDFLEGLAVFVAEMTCGGHKSAAPGVDLEFINNGIHYVVSIKSGPHWGNSSQQGKLEQDLKNAMTRLKQLQRGANVQPVLGICYGKMKTSYLRGYMKVVGQNFWYLISENQNLYTDLIEPVGYRAKEHNDSFSFEKGKVTNRLTKQFIDQFCDDGGAINWVKLVEFNSGNFDLQ
ncbi:MAG TPA: PmeII family type II restriction endonuclease [Anaerolineales bacterium]|nr:PmeII family type II restriction endonuclease [Anaerolineales bacterium]